MAFIPADFSSRIILIRRSLNVTPVGADGLGGKELRSVRHWPCASGPAATSCFQFPVTPGIALRREGGGTESNRAQ